MDWAQISENEKIAAYKDIESYESYESNATVHEFLLPNNKMIKFKANKNEPIRFANSIIQIDTLLPGVIRNFQGTNDAMPLFIIKGQYHGILASSVSISTPWVKPDVIKQFKLKGVGEFTLQFAPRSSNPELWEWMETKNETWMPIHIKIQSEQPEYDTEFIEWLFIGNELRNEFNKLLN